MFFLFKLNRCIVCVPSCSILLFEFIKMLSLKKINAIKIINYSIKSMFCNCTSDLLSPEALLAVVQKKLLEDIFKYSKFY